jgi:hypothetical protein
MTSSSRLVLSVFVAIVATAAILVGAFVAMGGKLPWATEENPYSYGYGASSSSVYDMQGDASSSAAWMEESSSSASGAMMDESSSEAADMMMDESSSVAVMEESSSSVMAAPSEPSSPVAMEGGAQAEMGLTPSKTTVRVYQEWVTHKGNPLADKIYMQSPYITDAFRGTLAAADTSAGSRDPLLCSDKRWPNFEVPSVSMGGGTATAKMIETFKDGTVLEFGVTLVKEGDIWKIDSVDCNGAVQSAASSSAM